MRPFVIIVCLVVVLSLFIGSPNAPATQASSLQLAESKVIAFSPVTFTTPGKVNTLIPLSDGSVLAGGQFVAVSGQPAPRSLAKILSNGTLDTSFQFDTNLQVTELYAAALQSDGKIVIAGIIRMLPSPFNYRLLRLNADGSLDESFQIVSTLNNTVRSVMMDGDKIVIGGNFTAPTTNIARLNADGAVDLTFSNVGTGPGGTVYALARQSNGKYILAGDFGLARLNNDGSRDSTFLPDGGGTARTEVAVLADDSVLAGSENPCYGNVFAWYTAQGDTKELPKQDPNLLAGITTFLPLPDGGFLIGGWYSYLCINSSPTEHNGEVWRFTANGDYLTMSSFGNEADVFALAQRNDGKVVVGGQGRPDDADQVGVFDGMALLDLANDGLDQVPSFHPLIGDEAEIYSLSSYPDGKLLVAGNFSHANGQPVFGLARLLANRTLDSGFHPFAEEPGGWSQAALALPDGRALAGFSHFSLYLVEQDGSLTDLSAYNDYDRVSALAMQADGKVLVGSDFGLGVRRLKADLTDVDPTFTGGDAYGSVYDLAVQGTQIYVAGDFTKYNNQSVHGLVRLNESGGIDDTFTPPQFLDDVSNPGELYKVIPLTDGSVLVGGYFDLVDGEAHSSLVRLNSDGSLDTSFTSPDSFRKVKSMCVQSSDGSIWVGGWAEDFFLSPQVQHFSANGALDSTIENNYLSAHGDDGSVNALLCNPDGLSWAGGRFSLIDNQPFYALAHFFSVKARIFLPIVVK
ncbi:MAG: delta-60 repeat domain-containing protein [Anaerolineales bacterium]